MVRAEGDRARPPVSGGMGTVNLPGYRAVGASTPLPERSSLRSPGGGGLLGKPGDQMRSTPSGNVAEDPVWDRALSGPLGLSAELGYKESGP